MPFGSAVVVNPRGSRPLVSADVAVPFGFAPFVSAEVAAPLRLAPFGSADVVVPFGDPALVTPFVPGPLLIAFLGAAGVPRTTPLLPGTKPLPGIRPFLPASTGLALEEAFFLSKSMITVAGCARAPECAPPKPIAATASSSRMATRHHGF